MSFKDPEYWNTTKYSESEEKSVGSLCMGHHRINDQCCDSRWVEDCSFCESILDKVWNLVSKICKY